MKEIHEPFKEFKKEFAAVYKGHEALGKTIHEQSGPLPEKTRWLIKIAVSGAGGHALSLETHILKGKESGLTDDEIKHALLLLIQSAGFPTFMAIHGLTNWRAQRRGDSLLYFMRELLIDQRRQSGL
jgi:4-carboxymuconolactone decarboxylase